MRKRILFLTQLLPYPPVCGGTIRTFNTLKRLCASHDVTLMCLVRSRDEAQHVDFLRNYCCEVITVPIERSALLNVRWMLRSLVRGSSFIVDRDHVPEMREAVDRILETQSFDLLYVDHLQMTQYACGNRRCPKILDEHNQEWQLVRRVAEAEPQGLKKWLASVEWPKLRNHELSVCEDFEFVCTVTEYDKAGLQAGNPSLRNVRCIPIGVDTDEFGVVEQAPDSRTILSVGTMSYHPNVDAVRYFHSEVYPRVKLQVPDARLLVVGDRPPASVRRLAKDPSVSVTGFVPDLREAASQAAAFIAPLRSGSGMRVKILNAMAMGLPVVSTTVGSEGIDVTPGENILLADSPGAFADQVVRLLLDNDLRRQLGAAGRELVVRKYSWEAILPMLDALVDDAIKGVGAESREVAAEGSCPQ